MCLAIPAKVVEMNEDKTKAKADFGGIKREINISLVDANVGEYVIVHAGFAIEVMDEKEAMETLNLWNEILELE
jgi:hydrogenase expression/formation protein HypC